MLEFPPVDFTLKIPSAGEVAVSEICNLAAGPAVPMPTFPSNCKRILSCKLVL